MKRFFNILLVVFSVVYPFFILAGFLWLKASPRVMALGLVALGAVYFLANSGDAKHRGFSGARFWIMLGAVALIALITFLTDNAGLLKAYPIFVNLLLLGSFGYTLFHGPTMIYRFAAIRDKSIKESPDREKIETYCRKVTKIWCVFFIANAAFSVITALLGDVVWSVYNGFVSYVLIGILFAGEMIYRKVKMSG